MKLFHNFTGRDPYLEPLLKRRGLEPAPEAPHKIATSCDEEE